MDEIVESELDAKQFEGTCGTSTTYIIDEVLHLCYMATDKLDNDVRAVTTYC